VPFSEQKETMAEGRSYIVYVYRDERTNRIVASSKVGRFLDKEPIKLREGQGVELLICSQTEIGYKAIIDNSHWGVLYKNEIFQPLRKGQQVPGFIKKIREDGKIDLCLQKPGPEKVADMSEKIIDALKTGGGFISITDKSPAEIIYQMFGVSKKTYKKAIGALYKKRLIEIESDGIRLIEKTGTLP
jgi:predicted RNA-binding protein (virulence factor B family)